MDFHVPGSVILFVDGIFKRFPRGDDDIVDRIEIAFAVGGSEEPGSEDVFKVEAVAGEVIAVERVAVLVDISRAESLARVAPEVFDGTFSDVETNADSESGILAEAHDHRRVVHDVCQRSRIEDLAEVSVGITDFQILDDGKVVELLPFLELRLNEILGGSRKDEFLPILDIDDRVFRHPYILPFFILDDREGELERSGLEASENCVAVNFSLRVVSGRAQRLLILEFDAVLDDAGVESDTYDGTRDTLRNLDGNLVPVDRQAVQGDLCLELADEFTLNGIVYAIIGGIKLGFSVLEIIGKLDRIVEFENDRSVFEVGVIELGGALVVEDARDGNV